MLPTNAMLVGAVVSTTVTVNVSLPVLLESSVALQVTVVGPSGKVSPDSGSQVTFKVLSTASVAPGVSKLTAAPLGPVASSVTSSTGSTTGAVVSSTVTVKEPLPTLPAVSVAVHSTTVSPKRKTEPEAGSQVTSRSSLSTRSLAVALKLTAAP